MSIANHFLRRVSPALLLAAIAGPCLAQEPLIVAGVEAPQPGLNCAAAADDTRVHFHFNAAAADFTQLTIYVDGEAADPEDVIQQWPTVTLDSGLHPGRNDVELVATRADGQRVSRRMPVTVAEAGGNDGAFVPCGGAEVVVEHEPEVIYDEPAYAPRTTVVYEDAPVYVYESYPDYAAYAPYAPLISFDLFSSRYHPEHHGYSGGYRHGYDDRPHYHHAGGDYGGHYEGNYQGHYEGHHERHEHDGRWDHGGYAGAPDHGGGGWRQDRGDDHHDRGGQGHDQHDGDHHGHEGHGGGQPGGGSTPPTHEHGGGDQHAGHNSDGGNRGSNHSSFGGIARGAVLPPAHPHDQDRTRTQEK